MTDLIPIEAVNSLELFVEGGLDDLLTAIEAEALDFEPDVTTAKGRTQIASNAHKVARSKTVIENAGKELVADWKQKAKQVDAARKQSRDFLDDLKARVREPLTKWEAEQDAIQKEAEQKALVDLCHEEALGMNDLFDREAKVRIREAELAEEKRQREQEEHDARVAAEAAEAAEKASEQARLAAEKAKELAEERAEQAERSKAEAVERERKRVLAEEKAKAEAKAKAERERRANLEHQREVNKAAFLELAKRLQKDFADWKEADKSLNNPNADSYGPEDVARAVVVMIAKNEVPGIRMIY